MGRRYTQSKWTDYSHDDLEVTPVDDLLIANTGNYLRLFTCEHFSWTADAALARAAKTSECDECAKKTARKIGRAEAKANGTVLTARSAVEPGIYSNLPRVVRVLGIADAGEFGAAMCPHCGAEGRYITEFEVEGQPGEAYGAMRGCFAQFPKHWIVDDTARIIEKIDRNTKRYPGYRPASWDQTILDVADAIVAGTIDDQTARARVANAKRAEQSYLARRRY